MGVYERSEVGLIPEFLCKYLWYIDFYSYVEDLYLIEEKALPYVVFTDNEVLYHLCCEVFWTYHVGVVAIVGFGSKREVNMI